MISFQACGLPFPPKSILDIAKADEKTNEMRIRTGSLYIPFRLNAAIAVANYLAGRPLDEGQIAPRHIPDQNGLPEWITVTVEEKPPLAGQ